MSYGVLNTIDSIMARVQKTESCWLWTGALGSGGYGVVSWQGELVRVHRLVYEQIVGPIPKGLELDHVAARGCTSRACVNPAHLEPVTHGENLSRITGERCQRGHSDWRIVASTGGRRCRSCEQENTRRWRMKA